jgi:endonuclease/exonuclease/phosphatase family metal-dependent hydrolase
MKKIESQKTGTSFPQSMPAKLSVALALAAVAFLFAWPAAAQCGDKSDPRDMGGKRDVDVMTVNLYVGGNIGDVMSLNPMDTNYVQELVATVTGVYYEIVASKPPVRLQTVANQILRRMPDLVAVEEASLIRVQSPGDLIVGGTTPATNVVYDYLKILVADLNTRGVHYKIASTANEIDVELPMMNLMTGSIDDVRLTDREAILVRADLPPGQLRVSHPQSGNFVNAIPIPALGIFVERGWCSVDVSMRGRDFRCVCTHTEEETAPEIQALQVKELLAGPAKTTSPIIVLGDFNADPLHRDGSYAYDLMPAAGFRDAWASVHPKQLDGGLTWGHDEFLADPTTLFDRRIDFAFCRGHGIVPTDADVLGLTTGLAQPPLWGSDHAAVSVGFMLK